MFRCCHSLTSLDLTNFNMTKVTNVQYMFEHCYSLAYLNISTFISSSSLSNAYMFERIDHNFKYCLKENNFFLMEILIVFIYIGLL